MKKILKLFKDKYLVCILILFSTGTFLRFYRLEEFVTFLGDQGRDAMILKRIITLEHLPAIGAPTSVGQVYLGPFYYYFIAPWLLIFRFEPIGLAFGVAFISSLFLLLNYVIVKDLFNKKIALISTFLTTFSFVIIDFSRFSWNPNLLPIFSLLTVCFLTKAVKISKLSFFLLAGAFLSFSIQLHYLALFSILPLIAILFIKFYEEKKKIKELVYKSFFLLLSFSVFSSPLLIFDLRHNFLNFRNFVKLFQTLNNITSNKLYEFIKSFFYLNKYSFNTTFNGVLSFFVIFFVFILFLFTLKRKNNLRIFFIFFFFLLLEISLYNGPKYPHYFGTLYLIYYTIIAYFLSFLPSLPFGKIALFFFLLLFLFFNARSYYFISGKGLRQIETAKKISRVILENIQKNKYTVTALPHKYSDGTYRYFLELWGKKPIDKDSLIRADELFAVCEKKCQPIGDPQWDIAYFAPNKIIGEWQINNIKIYKLIR